jgi:cytochrome c biogenesis protein CcmG, thiol:disulfide interchange protein DsbE
MNARNISDTGPVASFTMAPTTPQTTGDDPNGTEEPAEQRSRLHRTLTVVIPALVILGLLAYGILQPAPESSRPTTAPEFELSLLDGGTISDEDLAGDPVILNFWASWCIPCRQEMPAFERMWQKYKSQGLRVVGVNVQDSKDAATDFVDEVGVTYPIALDPHETLAEQLDVAGLPQTVFITKDYEVAGRESAKKIFLGAISETELEARIRDLLD